MLIPFRRYSISTVRHLNVGLDWQYLNFGGTTGTVGQNESCYFFHLLVFY
jgi:hypothetical protein